MFRRKKNQPEALLRPLGEGHSSIPDLPSPSDSPPPAVPQSTGWLRTRKTANSLTTVMGRISYWVGQYDASLRIYRDPLLEKMLTPGCVDRLIRNTHYRSFYQWLCLTREQQYADLAEFLGQDVCDDPQSMNDLLNSPAFWSLAPVDASIQERNLFSTTIIATLQAIQGAGSECDAEILEEVGSRSG